MRISDWSSDVCSSDLGGKEADHGLPPDGRALMEPGAVAGDAHVAVAAMVGVPFLHGRQALFLEQPRDVRQGKAGEIGGRLHRHRAEDRKSTLLNSSH